MSTQTAEQPSEMKTLTHPHPDALEWMPVMLGGYVVVVLALIGTYVAGGF